MTHADAFLAEILAHPDDDAPRLLFADWLEERGDPRGEFVRVQCALAVLPDQLEVGAKVSFEDLLAVIPPAIHWKETYLWPIDEKNRRGVLRSPIRNPACVLLERRERESCPGHDGFAAWAGFDPIGLPDGGVWPEVCWRPAFSSERMSFTFRRGFVEAVECTAQAWLAHADALTAAAPIREVRLTTWPGCQSNESTHEFWLRGDSPFDGPFRRRFKLGISHATDGQETVRRLLAAEWPRINFTLPESSPALEAGRAAAEAFWNDLLGTSPMDRL